MQKWRWQTREKPGFITYANFSTLEFDWMFVWGDQPDKILVNVEQQYTLSLPAVGNPTDRIAAVAFDLAIQVTTLSI